MRESSEITFFANGQMFFTIMYYPTKFSSSTISRATLSTAGL